MYSFKLRENKCLFKDGNFYLRKDSMVYIFNIDSLLQHIIP